MNRLLDTWTGDEVSLIDTLARPLPVEVICVLLGVPESDREHIHTCSSELAYIFDLVSTLEQRNRGLQGWNALSDYFRELIANRRHRLGDDLLSTLMAVESSDRLTEAELIAMATLLLFAGHDTTMNLIGNGTLALLRHSGELDRLRQEPSLIAPAVEELLRFDAPVQFLARVAREDFQLGGRSIRGEQVVMLCLGAANRDPDQFPDPDRLDISRGNNRHLSFGGGPHFCLGAPAADDGLDGLLHPEAPWQGPAGTASGDLAPRERAIH